LYYSVQYPLEGYKAIFVSKFVRPLQINGPLHYSI